MRSTGQVAYEAYREAANWTSLVTGAKLPLWDDLGMEIRTAWEASAKAVAVELANGTEVKIKQKDEA